MKRFLFAVVALSCSVGLLSGCKSEGDTYSGGPHLTSGAYSPQPTYANPPASTYGGPTYSSGAGAGSGTYGGQ